MVLVAFPLLALTKTSSPIAIAGVAVAGALPSFLCALPAGALVDRVDRRRLAAIVNIGRATALAAFALAGWLIGIELWMIYLTVAFLGVMQVVFLAVSQVSLPVLLAGDGLARANGQLTAVEISGQQVLGPALGGFLYGAAQAIPFAADALSFLFSGAVLQRALPDTPSRISKQGWGADIAEGLKWFLGQPALRLCAALISSLAFFQSMVMALLAIYGVRDLGLSHTGYGLLYATIAVGNLVGALGARRAIARLGAPTSVLLGAALAAVSYLILSTTHSAITAAGALSLEAVGVAVGNVTTITVRQEVIPEHLMGRVMTAFRMTILGFAPLGALAGGVAAASIGIRSTFLLAGLGASSFVAVLGPSTWRHLARLHPRESLTPAGT